MRLARPTVRWIVLVAMLMLPVGCADASHPPLIAVAGGTAYLDAARLAVTEAEESGALPPFDTLFVLESSNRAAPALAVAEEIVTHPGLVAVVGHANSASSLVTAQIYNEAEVVQIAPTSTAPSYSEAGPWSFRMVPSDDRQGPFLAEQLAEAFPDGADVALFYVNDDYGRGLRTAVRAALDPGRYPLVADLPHLEGELTPEDVQQGVSALEGSPPDVILWLARPEALEQFLPPIRERWPDLPVYGGDALARALVLEPPPSFWRSVRYSDFVDPEESRVAAFLDRVRERFGTEGSGGEVLTRDAVRIVLEAIREGARTSAGIRAYLESLGETREAFDGLSGAVAFDSVGDVRGGRYVMRDLGGGPDGGLDGGLE